MKARKPDPLDRHIPPATTSVTRQLVADAMAADSDQIIVIVPAPEAARRG
jgi:hypothetical protein